MSTNRSFQYGSLSRALNAPASQIATLGGWGPAKVDRFTKTVNEPFIVRTGSGGPIALKKSKWTADEDEQQVLVETEQRYGNAAHPPGTRFPVRQDDIRLSEEEVARLRAKEAGAPVRGFLGNRAILGEVGEEAEVGAAPTDGDENFEGGEGVMAILTRMREQK